MWDHPVTGRGELYHPGVAHHAAVQRDNTTLVVFGGYNGTQSNNEVWQCELTDEGIMWEKLDVDGFIPDPCHGHSVVNGAKEWLQFRGVNCVENKCTFYNELHSLGKESLSWQVVRTQGSGPTPQCFSYLDNHQ